MSCLVLIPLFAHTQIYPPKNWPISKLCLKLSLFSTFLSHLFINPTQHFSHNSPNSLQLIPPHRPRKRSCFINAGMGNNCDFKDLISAASARRIWQSPNSPGKKRSVLPALTSSSSSSDESSPSSSSAELLRNYLAAVAANEPAL